MLNILHARDAVLRSQTDPNVTICLWLVCVCKLLPTNMSWIRLFFLFGFALVSDAKRDREADKSGVPLLKNESTSVSLEQEVLNLLGLVRPPKRTNTTLFGRNMSAPRFMIELYNSLAANQSVSVDGLCCNSTVTDPRAVDADTIMSYLNHSKFSLFFPIYTTIFFPQVWTLCRTSIHTSSCFLRIAV